MRRAPVGALALAVLAAAALALSWPFGGGKSGGILDRALAAIGGGPVVHLVVREGWGGTLVDLATGKRSPVDAERELWYDPTRGVHETLLIGGQKVVNDLYQAVPATVKEFSSLARNYRNSLESGRASLIGSGVLDGMPVYWIRFETRHFAYAVGSAKMHEYGADIAISRDGYLPVGMRETVDGKVSPDGPSRILEYETLPAGSGDFTAPSPTDVGPGSAVRFGPQGSLTPGEAAGVLPALWDGNRLGDLPLAGISKLTWAARPAGADAWTDETFGVRLAYGAGKVALPTVPGEESIRKSDGPYVVIDEFPKNSPAAERIVDYEPPAGSLHLQGEHGSLTSGGVAISLVATSPELVVQAARALEPIPSR